MGQVYFLTGFPGFLGKNVVSRLLADSGTDEVVALVQEQFRKTADEALAKLKAAGRPTEKVTLVVGDMSSPNLGIDLPTRERVAARVTRAFHMAAAYNLALPREVGIKVNVLGTRHVLDFLETCPRFERLAYVSTCAISGSHQGTFGEEDFDVGQTFKNFYEETKYLAEGEVRGRWGRLPTTIFRPPVVVGDSKTGEIDKIDGPYYAFLMVSRGLHYVAAGSKAKLNLAPVDYVCDAMLALFAMPRTVGRVYALSDPAPLTFDEFFDATAEAMGKRRSLLRLPARTFKPLFYFPGMAKLSGVPRQSFDYSVAPVEWTCGHTLEALHGTEIRCPRFREYVGVLVRYFKEQLEPQMPRAGRW